MRQFANALVWLAVPCAFVGILAYEPRPAGPGGPAETTNQKAAKHEAVCGICRSRGEPLPEVIGPELVAPRIYRESAR